VHNALTVVHTGISRIEKDKRVFFVLNISRSLIKGKSVDGGSPTVFVHIQGTALENMMIMALFKKSKIESRESSHNIELRAVS
jgi:hypothetical protein